MSRCRFCEIAAERPRWAVSVETDIVCFKPFGASDPRHRIFVPRQHVITADNDPALTGRLFEAAARWAQKHACDFNLVVNCGPDAEQRVDHMHVHYIPRHPGQDRAEVLGR